MLLDVIAGYVWWCYAILHFGAIILGITYILIGAEDRVIIAIWCSIAAVCFAGLMKLTEHIPVAGTAIYFLLAIHIFIRLISTGEKDKEK